jgi:hypothetical protein
MVAVSVLFCALFFSYTPACGFEWVTDIEKGLNEAHERGAPVFIFLTQLT